MGMVTISIVGPISFEGIIVPKPYRMGWVHIDSPYEINKFQFWTRFNADQHSDNVP